MSRPYGELENFLAYARYEIEPTYRRLYDKYLSINGNADIDELVTLTECKRFQYLISCVRDTIENLSLISTTGRVDGYSIAMNQLFWTRVGTTIDVHRCKPYKLFVVRTRRQYPITLRLRLVRADDTASTNAIYKIHGDDVLQTFDGVSANCVRSIYKRSNVRKMFGSGQYRHGMVFVLLSLDDVVERLRVLKKLKQRYYIVTRKTTDENKFFVKDEIVQRVCGNTPISKCVRLYDRITTSFRIETGTRLNDDDNEDRPYVRKCFREIAKSCVWDERYPVETFLTFIENTLTHKNDKHCVPVVHERLQTALRTGTPAYFDILPGCVEWKFERLFRYFDGIYTIDDTTNDPNERKKDGVESATLTITCNAYCLSQSEWETLVYGNSPETSVKLSNIFFERVVFKKSDGQIKSTFDERCFENSVHHSWDLIRALINVNNVLVTAFKKMKRNIISEPYMRASTYEDLNDVFLHTFTKRISNRDQNVLNNLEILFSESIYKRKCLISTCLPKNRLAQYGRSSASIESTSIESTSIDRDITCVTCCAKKISVIFVKCGHAITCDECARKLNNCPYCRDPLTPTTKILFYLP